MKREVEKALEVITAGGMILYPTDTIWGIGCDATNSKAIDKVFALKNRQESKSLIVLLADFEQIKDYIKEVPTLAKDLIQFIDKPLTIIYSGAKNLAPNLVAADGSVAIRIVKHQFCQNLIRKLGKPLVSTSANISGEANPVFFANIHEVIKSKVDYIVPLEQNKQIGHKASTIIKLEKSGKYSLIRE